jgi:hypothetical protein
LPSSLPSAVTRRVLPFPELRVPVDQALSRARSLGRPIFAIVSWGSFRGPELLTQRHRLESRSALPMQQNYEGFVYKPTNYGPRPLA